tara:strand:+ start:78 stop:377 length:300 start_codon:yes stop_codon:yes gene_type:complete
MFFFILFDTQTNMNRFTALHNNSSDEEEVEVEEGEIVESIQTARLMASGRAFWEEQQKGKNLKWGDWCWTDEDDAHIEEQIRRSTNYAFSVYEQHQEKD